VIEAVHQSLLGFLAVEKENVWDICDKNPRSLRRLIVNLRLNVAEREIERPGFLSPSEVGEMTQIRSEENRDYESTLVREIFLAYVSREKNNERNTYLNPPPELSRRHFGVLPRAVLVCIHLLWGELHSVRQRRAREEILDCFKWVAV